MNSPNNFSLKIATSEQDLWIANTFLFHERNIQEPIEKHFDQEEALRDKDSITFLF